MGNHPSRSVSLVCYVKWRYCVLDITSIVRTTSSFTSPTHWGGHAEAATGLAGSDTIRSNSSSRASTPVPASADTNTA